MTTMQLFESPSVLPFPTPAGAVLSDCRTYRYALWRSWEGGHGYVCFIGLNPSTADEFTDDPTIRRCIAYAKAWGYSGLCMVNLFAYRATEPKDMLAVVEPIGADNDGHIQAYAKGAGIVVAAWGNDGAHLGRGKAVVGMIPGLHCLTVTKLGQPGHPIYLKASLVPIPYEAMTCAP